MLLWCRTQLIESGEEFVRHRHRRFRAAAHHYEGGECDIIPVAGEPGVGPAGDFRFTGFAVNFAAGPDTARGATGFGDCSHEGA